jgi:histidine triad (HIT) family protein
VSDCLFCKISTKQIPAKVLYEDHTVMAFEDIAPQAPVHVLVIPRKHIPSLAPLGEPDGQLLAHMTAVLNRLAVEKGVAESGYRVVINNGPNANQSVGHLHLHLLGGRAMSWPPG